MRSRTPASPERSYMTQGTMTPASLQAVLPAPAQPDGAGAMSAYDPDGSWVSTRSSSHLSSMLVRSALKSAVGAKICRSAVQPRRSLRCGQSVGTLMKLARRLVTMFRWSLSTSGSEQANVPTVRVAELSTTDAMLSAGSPATPDTSAYLK